MGITLILASSPVCVIPALCLPGWLFPGGFIPWVLFPGGFIPQGVGRAHDAPIGRHLEVPSTRS